MSRRPPSRSTTSTSSSRCSRFDLLWSSISVNEQTDSVEPFSIDEMLEQLLDEVEPCAGTVPAATPSSRLFPGQVPVIDASRDVDHNQDSSMLPPTTTNTPIKTVKSSITRSVDIQLVPSSSPGSSNTSLATQYAIDRDMPLAKAVFCCFRMRTDVPLPQKPPVFTEPVAANPDDLGDLQRIKAALQQVNEITGDGPSGRGQIADALFVNTIVKHQCKLGNVYFIDFVHVASGQTTASCMSGLECEPGCKPIVSVEGLSTHLFVSFGSAGIVRPARATREYRSGIVGLNPIAGIQLHDSGTADMSIIRDGSISDFLRTQRPSSYRFHHVLYQVEHFERPKAQHTVHLRPLSPTATGADRANETLRRQGDTCNIICLGPV